MSTHTTNTTASKPSFASIAARVPPAVDGQLSRGRENKKPSKRSSPTRLSKVSTVESLHESQMHQELRKSMSRLAVKEPSLALDALSDEQKNNISHAGLRVDDDQTQVSSSSTKPGSVDGKSTTSGHAFALDEKESLRPDDSASVKAAEEEEFGSGPASGAQNSRVGSEAGSRPFREQYYEISESIGSASHRVVPLGRRMIAGIEEEGPPMTRPPLASTLPAPVSMPHPELIAAPGPSIDFNYQEPDEKLFEALESPKDRMFLLELEQNVITFVRDSKESMIDLPPCNSFCRLLAHKLADYYALTHFVDNAVSSVRLYRTPYCRVPTPLSTLARVRAPIDSTPLSQPTMKIMRRAGYGKDVQKAESGATTTESSMTPSKAGSENGDESQRGTDLASPTDSSVAKDKATMTREEREAKYKETRERIFGPESEHVDGSEAVNEVSRTSSRNEKKKKKHKNNDDGFEARSQFNAYYPPVQYCAPSYDQSGGNPAYYGPYAIQPGNIMSQSSESINAAMLQQGYQQGFQSVSIGAAFSSAVNQNPMTNAYEVQSNPATYGSQGQSSYYPSMQQGAGISHHSPVPSSPAMNSANHFSRPQSQMSDQQWPQNNYVYPYQQPRDQQQFYASQVSSANPVANVSSVPYQFGQLPLQPGMPGARTQHPLPGSYKGQPFNPQTRAFVPTNGSLPLHTTHYVNSPSQSVGRNSATSFSNGSQYSQYGQQASHYPQAAGLQVSGSYNLGQEVKTFGNRKSSAPSTSTQSPVQSSLSKWGTPAHLPPKPPPPEAPSVPEAQHSLPMNNQFNVNIQPMSAGQPMPSFQNGVYSMPGAGPQTT